MVAVSLVGLLLAQPLFEERFERFTPPLPAPWASFSESPAYAFAAEAPSAHWGNAGLALSRLRAGAPNGLSLVRDFGTAVQGTLHFRFWFRLEQGPTDRRISPLQIGQPLDAFTLGELYVDEGGSGAMVLSCADQNFRWVPLPAALVPGRWHLLELDLEGLGTPDGGCRGAMDGQEAALGGFDWHARGAEALITGFNVVSLDWVGRYAIDDLTLSNEVLAMRAVLTGPEAADAGSCVPLKVSFQGRDGGTLPAPSTARLRLVADGGTLFADSECQVLLAAEVAPLNAVHVRPGPGGMTVELSANDLLGSGWAGAPSASSSVSRELAVGCGCAGSPGELAVWVALAWGVRRRQVSAHR